jgi:hypothetical protein
MSDYCLRKPQSSVTLLVLASLLLLAGCGEAVPTGKVAGRVLLDDKPYSGAAVVFLNTASGQGGTANIQPDGSFSIAERIPVGSYVVYLAPEIADDEGATGSGEEGTEGPVFMVSDESVPAKYWNEADSDVIIEITEGNNDVTVKLEKEG